MPWERSGTCKGTVHEPSGVNGSQVIEQCHATSCLQGNPSAVGE